MSLDQPSQLHSRFRRGGVDLKGEADLIEEIERLHGLDSSCYAAAAIGTNAFDSSMTRSLRRGVFSRVLA